MTTKIVIISPPNMNSNYEKRLSAVKIYLQCHSLRKTAKILRLPYQTIHRWVKWYRAGGEKNLRWCDFKKPWNRINNEIEEKIIGLKEAEPGLTVQSAQNRLKSAGFSISRNGIFTVWKRYGYVGFKKDEITSNFTEAIPWTKEATMKFHIAEELFASGDVKGSARILNSIPALPNNNLLPRIPAKFLNLRRRIERVGNLFGKVPVIELLKEIRQLFNECLNKKLYYSALRLGILESIALEWKAEPQQILNTVQTCKAIIEKQKEHSYALFWLQLSFLISEGIAYSMLGKIKETRQTVNKCNRLLKRRKIIPPYFAASVMILYTYIEEYPRAKSLLLNIIDRVREEEKKKHLNGYLAQIYAVNGEYEKAIQLSKYAQFSGWESASFKDICEAGKAMLSGYPETASSYATAALAHSKTLGLNESIFKSTLLLASIYGALGERMRARNLLKNLLPFLKKKGLKSDAKIVSIILGDESALTNEKDALPTVKLALLLRSNKYFAALSLARTKGLFAYFYQYIFLFPEVITNLLQRNRPLHLSKTILRYSVFNGMLPSFNIRLLGMVRVYRHQKYLKVKLPPKISAILIYLSIKLGEPGKSVPLKDLYDNFWNRSPASARNLSRSISELKKILRIHKHQLEINRYESILVNEGIYFTTDYQEFEQTLARAKALQRAGEWGFAKKEYLQAFKLFRGEPFKKNFDDWSVDMRFRILSELETEAVNFARACLERGNKRDAKRVLEKVLKIIPDSEEIKNLLNGLMVG